MRLKQEHFNTDNEAKSMLAPAHNEYEQMAQKCVESCICVDIMIAVPHHTSQDLATLATLPGRTGGDLIYFEDFDVYRHGEKLYYHMFRNMTRNTVTDVMFKMRVSTGLTNVAYIGSFQRAQTAELAIPAIDADKTISCVFRNDDTLADGTPTYA